jgi:hypothetical protein
MAALSVAQKLHKKRGCGAADQSPLKGFLQALQFVSLVLQHPTNLDTLIAHAESLVTAICCGATRVN